MKVLFFYNESAVEGKGNIDLFSTSKELRKLGHSTILIARKDKSVVQTDGIYPILPQPMNAFFTLPTIALRISTIIRKEKPDVIVAEGGWYIPVLLLIVNTSIPIVYVLRGLVLENLVAFHAKSILVKLAAKIFISMNYRILKKSPFLLGTNSSLCKFYSEKLDRTVELIGTHLVDLDIFKPLEDDKRLEVRKSLSIDTDKIAVLYSGAIEEWHFPYLVDLVDSIFDLAKDGYPVQFVIMGWGSKREQLVDHVKSSLSSSLVKVMPWLSHVQVPQVIAACDICVDPYLRPYPMNYAPAGKLMEYMACGKCVITTKGYSNEELIVNQQNGIIVDGSKDSLYNSLKNVLDSNRIALMGAQARKTIITRFTSENKPEVLERYLKAVVNRPR